MTEPTANYSPQSPGSASAAVEAAEEALSFPRPFGNYHLLERRGSGGMAVVYKARDSRDRSLCAIKIPKPKFRSGPARERFREEVRALEALAADPHPNVCGFVEAGEVDGVPYLAMPYVQGDALSFYVAHQRFAPENAAQLAHTLALGLRHSHNLGVIHRDLKPLNVTITPDDVPVIMDFGLGVALTDPATRLSDQVGFTPDYFPPEVIRAFVDGDPMPAPDALWDVYSLGVILYELLTGELPWPRYVRGTDVFAHMRMRLAAVLPDPRTLCPEVTAGLAAVSLRAIADDPGRRYESAESLAGALARALAYPDPDSRPRPARVPPERVEFAFVPTGSNAPADVPAGRIFLDVGNGLRPGVIDHHHLLAYAGSTTRLVYTYPDLLDSSTATRGPDDPLTLVLQEWPDLDAVTAAFLAREYLCEGAFPVGAAELVDYVDAVNRGEIGATRTNPFSLYSAYQRLINRPVTTSVEDRCRGCVRDGLSVVAYVAQQSSDTGAPPDAVPALDVPGLFSAADREAVGSDLARYEAKLADPGCNARRAVLHLPDPFGGTEEAETLFVCNVQNADDPDRCFFFKDWARTDAARCPDSNGFAALVVFHTEGRVQRRQCIISVRPGGPATLRGPGRLLDKAESARRRELNAAAGRPAVDDREFDPTSGAPRPRREGYPNADPWYDGRAHRFTIVDSPRSGTVLTEAEIERILLDFGRGAPPQPLERH